MGRGEKKTALIAVRVEPEVMAGIEAQADREDRPVAAMVRILVKEALAAREGKTGKRTRSTGTPVR